MIVQPLQVSSASRSVWIAFSAVATMVWSIDAMNSAIATTANTTWRRGSGSGPTGSSTAVPAKLLLRFASP